MINAMRYTVKLEEGGFTKEQAETNMKVIMEVAELVEKGSATKQDIQLSQMATQADIQELRTELKTEIQELRTELKTEIQKVKNDILKLTNDIQKIRTEVKAEIKELRKDLESMGDQLTIKLGGIMVIGIGVIGFINKL